MLSKLVEVRDLAEKLVDLKSGDVEELAPQQELQGGGVVSDRVHLADLREVLLRGEESHEVLERVETLLIELLTDLHEPVFFSALDDYLLDGLYVLKVENGVFGRAEIVLPLGDKVFVNGGLLPVFDVNYECASLCHR